MLSIVLFNTRCSWLIAYTQVVKVYVRQASSYRSQRCMLLNVFIISFNLQDYKGLRVWTMLQFDVVAMLEIPMLQLKGGSNSRLWKATPNDFINLFGEFLLG